MWREINKYYFWLLWFLSLLAGTAVYCIIFSPDIRRYCFALFARNVPAHTFAFELGATILLVVILLILWVEYRRMNRRRKALAFIAAGSQASIPQRTIDRFVSQAVSVSPYVKHVAVQSWISGESVDVSVRLKVTDEEVLSTLIADIQDHVRARMLETFGYDIIADFHVEITDIIPVHTTTHPPAAAAPRAPGTPQSDEYLHPGSAPESPADQVDLTNDATDDLPDDRPDDERLPRSDND